MAADLPGPEDIPLDPELLKTLASDSRRDILRHLKQRRMTLTELAAALHLGKATVLEHLKKLQESALIVRREDERLWVYYELTPKGRRLVTPGRTRFFLVMGLTAAAALVVGVLLTLAITQHNAPESGSPTAPALGTSGGPLVAEGPAVAWRALDDNVTLRIAQGGQPLPGTLFVGSLSVASDASGVVRLDAAQIDALPQGVLTLDYLPANATARVPLATTLEVREPQLALAPYQVVAGVPTDVALAFADPATPIPKQALVGDQTLDVANATGVGSLRLRAAQPGPVELRVGRLAPVALDALPDAAPTLDAREGNLTIRLVRADGSPATGVEAFVDGSSLGAPDANGTLALPLPAEGAHALRVVQGAGDVAFGFRVAGGRAELDAPTVTLGRAGSAVLDGRATFPAQVHFAGSAEGRFTLLAVADGRVVASQALRLAPGEDAAVQLTARLPPGPHTAELQLRAAGPYARVVAGNATGAPTPTTPTSATPAPTLTAPATYQPYAEDASGPSPYTYGVDAGTSTLVAVLQLGQVAPTLTSPASGTSMTPASPAVPGFEAVALVVALAAAILVLRRR